MNFKAGDKVTISYRNRNGYLTESSVGTITWIYESSVNVKLGNIVIRTSTDILRLVNRSPVFYKII